MDSIGLRIAARRKALHLPQIQLAELCGVHRFTISKWERGDRSPGQHILELSKALKTTAEWILSGHGDAAPLERLQRLSDLDSAASNLRLTFHVLSAKASVRITRALAELENVIRSGSKVKQRSMPLLEELDCMFKILSECDSLIMLLGSDAEDRTEEEFTVDIEEAKETRTEITKRLNSNAQKDG